MLIKKKSILVIVLSSIIICFVLIVTMIGSYFYLSWKKEDDKNYYLNTLYELNAKLYAKYISISSLIIKLGEEGEPIAEGHIKNKSDKKIISLKLRISLLDKDDKVLYMNIFYPLRAKPYFAVVLEETGNYLAPGDSISFEHLLKGCPNDILTYLRMKTRFVKTKRKELINIDYKIEELVLE